jgi:hypothetical protein
MVMNAFPVYGKLISVLITIRVLISVIIALLFIFLPCTFNRFKGSGPRIYLKCSSTSNSRISIDLEVEFDFQPVLWIGLVQFCPHKTSLLIGRKNDCWLSKRIQELCSSIFPVFAL